MFGRFAFVLVLTAAAATAELRSGDIIFHTSQSSQSRAVQLAMKSPYSHMGLVLYRRDKPYVFEASKTVRYTPLKEWIARGVGGKYVVKRLRDDSSIDGTTVEKFLRLAAEYEGKPYDLYFEWSDDRIYCSELVWKIYSRALSIEIGEFKTFREFDFSHPHVRAKLQERFGAAVPLDEKVMSPAAMFSSPLLTIVRN